MNIEKFFESVINQKAKIDDEIGFILEEIYKPEHIEIMFKKFTSIKITRYWDIFLRILEILLKIDDEPANQKH